MRLYGEQVDRLLIAAVGLALVALVLWFVGIGVFYSSGILEGVALAFFVASVCSLVGGLICLIMLPKIR